MADNPASSLEHLLRLFAEQADEYALLLLDGEGRIHWSNAGAARIFDRELTGQLLASLFTPDDIARGLPEHEIHTAGTQGVAEDDRWLVRRDGSRFWASGALVGLRGEHGELLAYGKVLRDRSDLWEQLQALRNELDASEAQNRAKDVFLSALSHELRTPLAPLSNATQLVRLLSSSNPDLDQPLRIIERQLASLRRLVDDLLDTSRIGTGKIELQQEPLSLREVVNRAVEKVRPLADKRRQRLEVLAPAGVITVRADDDRLEQVFVNLIDNAVKYTPEGGRIWIKITTEGTQAVVHVVDSGIGIPPEMLPRIFDLFTQVESSRAQSQGGMGIGLALVKKLVTLHGGSVQVRSEGPGKGSEFSVRLPLAPPDVPTRA